MLLELCVLILMKDYFIQVFGCNIVGFYLRRCEWRIVFCGEVVIFGSLDAIMLTL
jgi:hypothetical protein